jgi:DNA-binding beta-propeller fold protein YncE
MNIRISPWIYALLLISPYPIFAQTQWQFETYAGTGGKGDFLDGDRKTALMHSPEGITIDNKGNLYITEYRTSIIRKIDANGQVSLIAGQPMKTGFADGKFNEALIDRPHGIAVNKEGNIFFCDMKNHLIRKISTDGIVSTYAGKAGVSGTADGVGEEARFYMPEGVALDSKGNLYVVDTYNYTVRKIDKNRRVTTVAGKGGEKGYADGKGLDARFDRPIGLAIDKKDNVYIVDAEYDSKTNSGNCVIRKLNKKGKVTTFCGTPKTQGHKDGKLKEAQFHRPVGITIAPNGTMYIADTEADLIRMIDKKGNVTTLGGQYLEEKIADGIGNQAAFFDPQSLVIAPNGDLFITDTLNHRIVVGRVVLSKK